MKKSQIAGILFGVAMGVLFSVSLGTVGFVLGAKLCNSGHGDVQSWMTHRIKSKL